MNSFTWTEFQTLQSDVALILDNSFMYQRVSHAYLFEGPKGTKKKQAAELFAKRILCLNPTAKHYPCGVCHSCKTIVENKHPNVFFVRPDGEVLKKDQMKQLIQEFSKTALVNQPRVCIILDSHKMNQEAANTMLKFIEEPTEDVYFVFVTEQVDMMIKTILSRTQVLHFKPIHRHILKTELLKANISERLAIFIPEYTNDFDSAMEYATQVEFKDIVEFCLQLYLKLLANKESLLVFSKKTKELILRTNEFFDFFLTVMIVMQKDILYYKKNQPAMAIDTLDETLLSQLARKQSLKTMESRLQEMLDLKNKLRFNINQSLVFDQLILHLERT